MMRSPAEIRAEIDRLKAIITVRDAAMASFEAEPPTSSQDVPEAMVRALTWVLGETESSAVRVKVR